MPYHVTFPATLALILILTQVKQKLALHDARAQQRMTASMERMQNKHVRELQLQLETKKVQLSVEVKKDARQARQVKAELDNLKGQQTALQDQLQNAISQKNTLLRTIGREKRQHDVERRTLEERAENLEAALTLRERKESLVKRNYKQKMAMAEEAVRKLRLDLKASGKLERKLRWANEKRMREVELEKESLNVQKWGLQKERAILDRQVGGFEKRTVTLAAKEGECELKRLQLKADTKVQFFFVVLPFYSLAFPVHLFSLRRAISQTLSGRMAKIVASRKVANQQKKQANKKVKVQSLQLAENAKEKAKLRLKVKNLVTACGTPTRCGILFCFIWVCSLFPLCLAFNHCVFFSSP